ncbi:MAG: hypothetical protein AAFQ66_05385 [Pseudomonadota bacterium]
MNHEAKVIAIRQMIQAVRAETLKIMSAPSQDAHSSGYADTMAKVERWKANLERFQRSIRSDQGLLHMRFGHRRLSYPERQSQRSHQANIDGLRALTIQLAQAIMELIDAMMGPDVAWKNLIKSLEKMLKGGGDDVSLSGTDQQSLQSIVQQAPGGSGGGYNFSPTAATDLLTFCIALYAMIIRNRKK